MIPWTTVEKDGGTMPLEGRRFWLSSLICLVSEPRRLVWAIEGVRRLRKTWSCDQKANDREFRALGVEVKQKANRWSDNFVKPSVTFGRTQHRELGGFALAMALQDWYFHGTCWV